MLRKLLLAATLASATPAIANPNAATVELSNFKFAPSAIKLQARTPTILLLKNSSSGSHSFSAPAFFAGADIDPASTGLIHNGEIEIPAHATVQVTLTPAAGQYPLKCTHPFHSAFGMKGTIIVR